MSLFCFYSAPSVSVHISDIDVVATPTAGEIYQLICNVSGGENLNPTTAYIGGPWLRTVVLKLK